MKKTYKLITTFIVLLSLVTFNMEAQISGVVTINSGAATAGTNYQTFTALATDLNTNGISGPVTVNVVASSGPYTEQFSLDEITGMSATNSITINGNGNLLTYNGGSGNLYTMRLNGTDYLYVNNLQIQGTNATYAVACLLTNTSDHNNFAACSFSVGNNSTSSQTSPFVFSSSATGISAGGDAGNWNTITGSTLAGGYYGVYHYGLTSGAYTHDNSFIGCHITDFYYYFTYCYYSKNLTFKNCQIDRLTRTSFSTTYLLYGYYSQGLVFEGNIIEKLYDSNQSYTGTLYGIRNLGYYNPAGAEVNPCRVVNNIFRNIEYNGTMYLIYYPYYSDTKYYHNTFSLDDAGATGGTTYIFYYCYGGNGMAPDIQNNNITITRGGTAAKYAFYNGGNALNGAVIDYNNIYVNGGGTNNYIGYITSQATTHTQWQSQGVDANGTNLDPMYASLVTGDLHPTNNSMNNLGNALGVPLDNLGAPRSQSTPDMGALEFLSLPCVGTPSANSIVTPTYALCPGSDAILNVANYTSDTGVMYQWLSSTSSTVGPWTPIAGANSIYYTTPTLTNSTYYGVAITCTNAVGSVTAAGIVNIAGTTTNTAPYYENFDLIPRANSLPNCSWYSPDLGGGAYTYTSSNTNGRVPRSGTSFASFYYNPAGDRIFYTNGIELVAGITYSASVWYQTEYYGYNNWTDLSILYGTTQTTTGLVSIASTNGPAISNVYKSLSNTFTVSSTGIYYVAVRGSATTGSSAQYLSWDDLAIEIPCSVNAPTMAVTANTTSLCSNELLTLTASGADNYSWNTGANTNVLSGMPSGSGVVPYTVIGTSTLTGCTTTVTQNILVNQAPNILAYAGAPGVCSGESIGINAIGGASASSYTWSNGANASYISVNPTANTSYTVLGASSNGCVGTAIVAVTVYSLPVVAVSSSQPNDMCAGETQVLTATGGVSFEWSVGGSGAVLQGNPVNINPTSTTVYTVTATNSQGCSNKSTITQNVNECVGLKENTLSNTNIYPNPTSGEITVELNTTTEKTIQVMDLTGRVVSSSTSSLPVVKINLNELANGVYYVKIQSSTSTEVVKIVKH